MECSSLDMARQFHLKRLKRASQQENVISFLKIFSSKKSFERRFKIEKTKAHFRWLHYVTVLHQLLIQKTFSHMKCQY